MSHKHTYIHTHTQSDPAMAAGKPMATSSLVGLSGSRNVAGSGAKVGGARLADVPPKHRTVPRKEGKQKDARWLNAEL